LSALAGLSGSLHAGIGVDTLVGPTPGVGSVIEWNITSAGEGHVRGIDFEEFENLTGGSNLDLFAVNETGSVSGTINGGASSVGERDQLSYVGTLGPIVVDLAAKLQPRIGLLVGIEEIVGTSSAADEIRGLNAANTWSLTGADTGTVGTMRFVDIENLTGGTLADSFSLVAGGSIRGMIHGGDGVDTLLGANSINLWNLVGSNAGTLNAMTYQAIESLSGGTNTDTFTLDPTATVAGTLNGGSGTADRLDYSQWTTTIVTDLQTRSLPGGGIFTGVEEIVGSSANDDKLVGPNVATAWTLSGLNTGTAGKTKFFGFESLQGGTANDTFTFIAGGTVASIEGGDGLDTILGPNTASVWSIDAVGVGTINMSNFSSTENLTGGADTDVFNIGVGGWLAGSLSGGSGARNVLSYATWVAPVAVNLSTRVASGIAGLVSNFTIVIGGTGDDHFTGNTSLISILIGGAGNDSLTGGSGRDILIGGYGGDTLTGAAGDDLLIAGPTTYDNDFLALSSIMDEWSTTARNYQTRVGNIRGNGTGSRLNLNYFLRNLPADSLLADPGTVDQLFGGLGQDWFITDDSSDATDQALVGLTAEDRDDASI
jgi:RTX calcium-binding nonapeptide repeat (4 copies)